MPTRAIREASRAISRRYRLQPISSSGSISASDMPRDTHLMTNIRRTLGATRLAVLAAGLAVLTPLASCSRDDLLKVTDPDIINPTNLDSPDGAEGLRVGALARFKLMTALDESSWFYGGLLVDEWKSSDTFTQRDETDQRNVTEENSLVTVAYRQIHRARVLAFQAAGKLRQYKPNATSEIGEMWFVKGYAEMQSAADFCNGQPFADLSTGIADLGQPVTSVQAYTLALESFDSALVALGTAADSVSNRVRFAAQVGRGRVLLNLNRPADAVTAVSNVPSSFAFNLTWPGTQGKEDNLIWGLNISARRYTVQDSADSQGGIIPNSMPFVSANDQRVPTFKVTTQGLGFDGVTPHLGQRVFPAFNSLVPVANYADARLILAEAQL